MVQKITTVEEFRNLFNSGDLREIIVASGCLRTTRAINRIRPHRDPNRETYEVWSMVDGSVERYSLQKLLLDGDAFLGKCLRNGNLYLDN